MNYKLAKQLKDAGFPQKVRNGNVYHPTIFEADIDAIYFPTLEELIKETRQKGRELSLDECEARWGREMGEDGHYKEDKDGKWLDEVILEPVHWEAKIDDWNSNEYGKRHCYEDGDETVAWTKGKDASEAMANLYIKLKEK